MNIQNQIEKLRRTAETGEQWAEICALEEQANRLHPDYGTPNWCRICSPQGLGYCRCEVACNE
jgi:hypothetical protein